MLRVPSRHGSGSGSGSGSGTSVSQFQAAINRKDTSQAEVYKNAFEAAHREWRSDAETYKSVCS